ncbi:sulfite exporter TauE/SafE family protein [Acidiferrobacter sp.]|uniref:sulfite exporter TauE/SafE family protein n=1 Tax=Acidiferrobacter sp. TaxID=1872107 RepID=UPI002628FFB3|nr:sulfite exporter TauE/SafE family protein [Acidiferrobacter sp.]
MAAVILISMGLGLVTGLLTGMLGIGGGSVVVPALVYVFAKEHLPAGLAMKLAIGTSLANILFTSLAAISAQQKRRAIDWSVAAPLGAATLVGSLASGYLAGLLPGLVLKEIFGVFLTAVGLQLFADWHPAAHWRLPSYPGLVGVGIGIGAMSALLGIGGGSLTVPFLTACNVDMRRAIAISATLGFPIALFGAMGLALSGQHRAGLPPGALGYIYLPALAGLTTVAMLVVPVGVYLAHNLPVAQLKRVFGVLLIAVGVQMVFGT